VQTFGRARNSPPCPSVGREGEPGPETRGHSPREDGRERPNGPTLHRVYLIKKTPGGWPLPGAKTTEGVGERPRRETGGRFGCHWRGAEPFAPHLHPLASPRSVKLEPLSRRRPLSPTGTGGVEARRNALTALRLAPARVTQSTTSFEVEDWKRRVTSSSGALSCARPFSPLTSSSSFASSPCCPPSHE
jgi:hypothetical protein